MLGESGSSDGDNAGANSSTRPAAIIHPRKASRNAAATTGLFQQVYSYVHPFESDDSSFPAKVCCPLCMEVYATPIRLQCCQTLVCSTCVRRWMKVKTSCPWCRSVVDDKCLNVDREVKKVVDDLDVYCANKRRGCQWVGPRKYLLIHVAEECLITQVLAGRRIQSQPDTLFYLSLIDNPQDAQKAVKDLYPRASSIIASIIPARYRSKQKHIIPPRVSSVNSNESSSQRRPFRFKKAGARGSVLVPLRDQSVGGDEETSGKPAFSLCPPTTDPECRGEPRRSTDSFPSYGSASSVSSDEEETEPSNPALIYLNTIRDTANVLEDEEYLSLGVYESTMSGSLPASCNEATSDSDEEDEILRLKRQALLGAGPSGN
ncbi:hypothetical protein BC832DRAFT_46691 [Gaertneriomyces semiglobifer]|nr:hypothetical protein BC832DRAFT_46691 [Gaertneriomyces semiglobifer]